MIYYDIEMNRFPTIDMLLEAPQPVIVYYYYEY